MLTSLYSCESDQGGYSCGRPRESRGPAHFHLEVVHCNYINHNSLSTTVLNHRYIQTCLQNSHGDMFSFCNLIGSSRILAVEVHGLTPPPPPFSLLRTRARERGSSVGRQRAAAVLRAKHPTCVVGCLATTVVAVYAYTWLLADGSIHTMTLG